MKNFIQPGAVLTLTAPYQRNSGQAALIGAILAVATTDIANGASGEWRTEGVHTLEKTASQAWSKGNKIYWDITNKRCDNTPVGPLVGVASEDVAGGAGDTTGYVKLLGVPGPRTVIRGTPAPVSDATAGAKTLTAAEVLSGTYVRDCAGAGRTDTLPTAALLVAAIPGAQVGDTVELLVVNGSDAAETLTLAAGAGGAFDANQTAASRVVPQNASKLVRIRLTNVTAAAEAYVVYA